MAKLPENFNLGDRDNITPEKLLELLEKMYRELAGAINKKPDLVERSSDGLNSDVILSNGTININSNTQKVEMLTKHVNTSTVTWKTLT